jgi:hypothetical protein
MAMKKMEVADRERKLFSNRNQYSNENQWREEIVGKWILKRDKRR